MYTIYNDTKDTMSKSVIEFVKDVKNDPFFHPMDRVKTARLLERDGMFYGTQAIYGASEAEVRKLRKRDYEEQIELLQWKLARLKLEESAVPVGQTMLQTVASMIGPIDGSAPMTK